MTERGLVTLGETMGRLAPDQIGPLHHVPHLRLSIAGSESNVAIGVRRLGVPATWISRVGQDEIGDLVLRELRAEDVATRVVRDDTAPTGLMITSRRTEDIVRVSYYRANSAASRLCPADLDEAVIGAAGVLHVTGITSALGEQPAAAVDAAVEIARAAGVPVSLDLNYRARLWRPEVASRALRALARRADLVFAGEQEAELVLDDAAFAGVPAEKLARGLADLGPTQVVIKRGRLGCVALVDDVTLHHEALSVRAVDPVGAGDAFVAGYLAELLAGRPPAERLATANATGAFAVTVSGDWEAAPTRAELALLRASEGVIR